MTPTTRRRGHALVVAVALLAQACSSSLPPPTTQPQTPTPAASATPAATPSPTAPPKHSLDNQIDLAGLRHDSRDLLYRTPAGAVPAGTPVTIRLRTFHTDASGVKLRLFSLNSCVGQSPQGCTASAEQLLTMSLAATDVSCYDPQIVDDTCDFWEVTLPNTDPDNVWYRFVVSDGTATAYYADDTPALDGGAGAATTDPVDNSYALTVYTPGFTAPKWPASAVMYQIFPDRFRDGNIANDPKTSDTRYDQPVLKLDWNTLPEGYCRGYADAATNCPWRFEKNPPSYSPTIEGPQGRDYMGGDLAGVTAELDYLKSLGVTTIYLNPIFDAASNHGYDTQDYTKVDPYFGTQADFDALVAAAKQRSIGIILDGVFNHMSSDSPFFDRYGHYDTVGACESADSPWRQWFTFDLGPANSGPCAAPGGPGKMIYSSWAGFDSIPVINKQLPDVLDYFVTGVDSITKRWLGDGTAGWRMDVSGDPSFPVGYWEAFRQAVKSINPDALTISETWQKDGALLRAVRGDRFDTTMNYRLRDAVLGLLTPTTFDAKGFPDSGRQLTPTEFGQRLLSMQEDYAPATYYSLMNLLDSHDTERALWALTPGPQTQAGREQDAANVAEGKTRLKLASLIQFTVPGMPSIYYGDEVGMTGQTDPDDRRTYPWADLGGTPDQDLLAHYQKLAGLKSSLPALADGDLRVLMADDTNGVVVLGRRDSQQAVVVAVNRSASAQAISVPTYGFVPDGTSLAFQYQTAGALGEAVPTAKGVLPLTLPPMSGVVLATTGNVDLAPPAPPASASVQSEGDGRVAINWPASKGAVGYNIYRSPLAGGGWVKLTGLPLDATTFADSGLANAKAVHYVVTAVDAAGNESGYSSEAVGLPHLLIGQAVLAGPPSLTVTINAAQATAPISGRLTVSSVDTVIAQVGFGPAGSAPAGNPDWTWVDAAYDSTGAPSTYTQTLLPDHTGSFDYVYRFSTTNGRDWVYADTSGIFTGTSGAPGKLTVNPSSDTSPPATPTGLRVVSASVVGVDLTWDAVTTDPTLYGYEIARSDSAAGPFRKVTLVTDTKAHDPDVSSTAPIYYVVRAVDTSFNRSPDSPAVEAKPGPRPVSITFNVTVPMPAGPAVGRDVYIAGTLDKLDPTYPQWNPAGVKMTKVDDTHWTVTLNGIEGTSIEYKYVLADWTYVEKDASCAEISNRQLTVAYSGAGTQTVEDTVANWRNVGGCPN